MTVKNKQRIAQYKEILLSPDLSPEKLENTLTELLKTTSPEAMQLLAEAVAEPYSSEVQNATYARLQAFNFDRPVPIAAVCAVWQRSRNPKLKTLLQQKNWVANAPLDLKILTHLLLGRLDNLDDGSLDFVAGLAQILHHTEPEIATNAHILAGQIKEPNRQALLLFLSGQWEQHESLDFDQRLMRLNYQAASETLRRTIMNTARTAGRTNFTRIVTNSRSSQDISKISAAELDLLLDLLTQNERWDELWHLVHNSSINHSLRIMHKLSKTSWQPSSSYQQTHFNHLKQLASQLKEGFIPANKLIQPEPESLTLIHHPNKSVNITYDGNFCVYRENGSIRIYSLTSFETSTITSQNVRGFYVSPVEPLIFYQDNSILILYDYEKAEIVWSVDLTYTYWEKAYFFISSDQKSVIFANSTGIRIFNRLDGSLIAHLTNRSYRNFDSMNISPDGKFLASGSGKGSVTIYNINNWQITNKIKIFRDNSITDIAFAPDNYTLACYCQWFHYIELLNIKETQPTKRLATFGTTTNLSFSPFGQLLISLIEADKSGFWLRFWHLANWHTHAIKLPFYIRYDAKLIFSPDKRKLFVNTLNNVCDTQWLRLWEFPIEQLTTQDLEYILQELPDQSLTESERTWLLFTKAILEWRLQHEIEIQDIADSIPAAEWDIELDG